MTAGAKAHLVDPCMAVACARRGGGLGVGPQRRSFTLVELMLVTAIIAVLASSLLFALYGAMEQAREQRTRTQIVKINELILQRWEAFRSRKLPLLIPPSLEPVGRARVRLHAIRDLMRMELPDRITDLTFSPTPMTLVSPSGASLTVQIAPPSLWRAYRRRAGFGRTLPSLPWPSQEPTVQNLIAMGTWTATNQGSECLYLILGSIPEGDGSALEFFKDSEIGDTDSDGMLEVLDAWGRPIEFLRWAPGFATLPGPDLQWGRAGVDDDGQNGVDDPFEIGVYGSDDGSELQSRNAQEAPDAFDPLHVDPRWSNSDPADDPFALFPLIYSAGRDGVLDIATENPRTTFAYAVTEPAANDPYAFIDPDNQIQAGRPIAGTNGALESEDNITNHLLEAN